MWHSLEFPQELIVEVIDYILVRWSRGRGSRAAGHTSLKHLLTSENIALFRNLLLSPECTFSAHIRRIKASRYPGSPDGHAFDDVAAALRGLHIRELHIKMKLGSVRDNAYPLLCTGFMTAFPHAKRLELGFTLGGYWLSQIIIPICEMLSFFPALLKLQIFDFWNCALDSPDGRLPPPELHYLELRGLSITPILGCLGASNRLSKVDSLALSSISYRNSWGVCAAMKQIGGTLRHRDIDLKDIEGAYQVAQHIFFLIPCSKPAIHLFSTSSYIPTSKH
ncbi:hypothetical protein C8R45DRAFT_1182306 [Mycena sanguinolenta]|nr:hypothetical protein C8R45DRAFT_1182306 [Mycena sanguinolenta]